ncbi:MAG: hypothetical protein UY35_C0005G0026 [Candidatus Saccharibacteria bacterium GW2011_GWC2_48_9]|nr:MAG: hypothetical protein UY35_C0005G0026 [Candidatus Saccharibacteria bacterium GW2011_GWC2_48_9]HCH34189.1 hypothetical protein [Candidatus Saccharibacteria bacterium]
MSSSRVSAKKTRPVVTAVAAIVIAVLLPLLGSAPANAATGFPALGTHDIPGNTAKCALPEDYNLRNGSECAVGRIEQFLQSEYGSTTVRPSFRAVTQYAAGVVLDPRLPCGYIYGASVYCATIDRVYVGLGQLPQITDGGTKVGIAAILSHELGHHLQTEPRAGGTYAYAGYAGTAFEDQADCASGAFFKYGVEQGWYTSADVTYATSVYSRIGSPEGSGNAHSPGTVRAMLFEQGVAGGLQACGTPNALI